MQINTYHRSIGLTSLSHFHSRNVQGNDNQADQQKFHSEIHFSQCCYFKKKVLIFDTNERLSTSVCFCSVTS